MDSSKNRFLKIDHNKYWANMWTQPATNHVRPTLEQEQNFWSQPQAVRFMTQRMQNSKTLVKGGKNNLWKIASGLKSRYDSQILLTRKELEHTGRDQLQKC